MNNTDYEDFFLTSVAMIKGLSFSPNGPLLLMIDDADNLPERMQLVLNSWVSYRTTDRLCLKISTQQKYKTWRTKQGILIENPHDFSEIDISSVYTSKSSSLYYDRVYAIVKRRLELSGLTNISPTDFFPSNTSQDERLEEVKKRIGESWDSGKKVSSRKNDDILRYATSEYMKELASAKKQNTFSYAGFNSLVNLSSGMIRNFLDPAATMYAYESSKSGANEILSIPHEVQQTIIREWSESYILNEIGRADQDTGLGSKSHKLKNLISGIGMLFQKKLVSNDSERRYISFMLSNETEKDDQDVLDLGVELGVLQKSTIARKEGFGRNFVYILNRRLAPFYKIDPAGYAAHMSITPEYLRQAMQDPREFVKTRLKENNNDSPQISIFEEDAS